MSRCEPARDALRLTHRQASLTSEEPDHAARCRRSPEIPHLNAPLPETRHRKAGVRVFVFDHNVRNATRPGLATPSRQVHNDHTVNSAPRRVRDHLGGDAEELLKHRFGIVNVWRPIRGPVLDSPLALCDARSFTDDDLIASDLVYAHVRGETSRVEYSPRHRWYYFSEMQADEVLLIRVHDSANDGRARLSFHTSFENPLTPGAPPRESIEVRTLVFFPPAA